MKDPKTKFGPMGRTSFAVQRAVKFSRKVGGLKGAPKPKIKKL